MEKAAIYHSTNKSKIRPKIYEKDLTSLEECAKELGYSCVDIFCDRTLLQGEHTELRRFLDHASQYDALITKDCRRISKNTMQCFRIMGDLLDQGLAIYTCRDGMFVRREAAVKEHRTIATYICHEPTDKVKDFILLQQDIFKTYVNKKTSWKIAEQYSDISHRQRNGEQVDLQKLIDDRDKYDLLLVRNLNDVHWRTADFCRIRHELQMDIFSLQDGYLPI